MLASFFWGTSGSVTSVITGVTAYLAAVTGPEERIGRLLGGTLFSAAVVR